MYSCYVGIRLILITQKRDFMNIVPRLSADKTKVFYCRQTKTGVPLELPLHPVVGAILGKRGEPNELVFKLPCYETVFDVLQGWVDNAKIKKKITRHCLRHSVSDILLEAGMDVHTVAAFLGQTTAKQVLERYKKRVRLSYCDRSVYDCFSNHTDGYS